MVNSIFLKKVFLAPLLVLCLCYSCRLQNDVFENNKVISDHEWNSKDTVSGNFLISDTLSYFNIYLVLRHTDAYHYNNVWLNIGLQSPGDTMFLQRTDLQLGDDANGWEGTGMNDIWEVRKLLNGQPRRFKKTGNYEYVITQIMREDPLPGVMSVGLRVEKIANR